MKWKLTHTFAFARARIYHSYVNGVCVGHVKRETRNSSASPWEHDSDEYFINGGKQRHKCQSEAEVPAMVERYLKANPIP